MQMLMSARVLPRLKPQPSFEEQVDIDMKEHGRGPVVLVRVVRAAALLSLSRRVGVCSS